MLYKLSGMKSAERVKRHMLAVVHDFVGDMVRQPEPQLFACDETWESDNLSNASPVQKDAYG